METRLYFQILRRGWWIVVATALLALVVSLAVSYLTVPQYRATASFILIPSSAALSSGPDVVRSYDTIGSVSVISTYVQIMNSARIYNDTLATLGLQPQDLKDYTYQAVVLPSTSILELSVTGPNPNLIATLANTIGDRTINYAERMNQVFLITFLDTAVPPKLPVSPQPLLNGAVALVFGLVAGAVLAVVRDQIRIPLETYLHRFRLDPVTDVYNHRYFPHLIEEELAQSPSDVFSIGLVELTGLRDTMETLPTVSLQWILRKITDTLRKELRGNDVIGRLNEISFEVMLPNTPGTAAKRIFERIYQALSEPLELTNLSLTVSLDPHIGSAEYSNNIPVKELYEKAQDALGSARRDSANPVHIWGMKNPLQR